MEFCYCISPTNRFCSSYEMQYVDLFSDCDPAVYQNAGAWLDRDLRFLDRNINYETLGWDGMAWSLSRYMIVAVEIEASAPELYLLQGWDLGRQSAELSYEVMTDSELQDTWLRVIPLLDVRDEAYYEVLTFGRASEVLTLTLNHARRDYCHLWL